MLPLTWVYACCMLITGSLNTISTKYQDLSVERVKEDGTPVFFQHPAFQSAMMFTGEALCLIPYFILRWRRRTIKAQQGILHLKPPMPRAFVLRRVMAFAIPTLCDATATTLLNIGLFYTFASTFQMLRGTLVLFAGLLTILVLKRRLYVHHWLGMVLIAAGAAIVGLASVVQSAHHYPPHHPHPHPSNSTPAWANMHTPESLAGLQPQPATTQLSHLQGLLDNTQLPSSPPSSSSSLTGQQDTLKGSTQHSGSASSSSSAAAAAALHAGAGAGSGGGASNDEEASRRLLNGVGALVAWQRSSHSSSSSGSGSSSDAGNSGEGEATQRAGSGGTPHWMASVPHPSKESLLPLVGDGLVVAAQLFAALQFVLEERYLERYHMQPLLAVGLEGMWGVVLSLCALPLLGHFKAPNGLPLEDAVAAFNAVARLPDLRMAVIASVLSIGAFNWFGLSVTQALSGASRATIDACRTLLVWFFSLAAGWETFHVLQVIGFVVLISGTSLYNELLRSCLPPTRVPSATDLEYGAGSTAGDEDGPYVDATEDSQTWQASPYTGGGQLSTDRPKAGWLQRLLGRSGPPDEPPSTAAASGSEPGLRQPLMAQQQQAPQPARSQAIRDARIARAHHQHHHHNRNPIARSIRLGFNALSPHSLGEQTGLGVSSDEEEQEGLARPRGVLRPIDLASTPISTPHLLSQAQALTRSSRGQPQQQQQQQQRQGFPGARGVQGPAFGGANDSDGNGRGVNGNSSASEYVSGEEEQ